MASLLMLEKYHLILLYKNFASVRKARALSKWATAWADQLSA